MGSPRLLLAEDDEEFRTLVATVLRRDGYEVVECTSGLGLVEVIAECVETGRPPDFHLVITDIRMPGVTGMEALEGARSLRGWPPTIVITAFGDEPTHQLAARLGAAAFFDKPFELDDLLRTVRALLAAPHDGEGS